MSKPAQKKVMVKPSQTVTVVQQQQPVQTVTVVQGNAKQTNQPQQTVTVVQGNVKQNQPVTVVSQTQPTVTVVQGNVKQGKQQTVQVQPVQAVTVVQGNVKQNNQPVTIVSQTQPTVTVVQGNVKQGFQQPQPTVTVVQGNVKQGKQQTVQVQPVQAVTVVQGNVKQSNQPVTIVSQTQPTVTVVQSNVKQINQPVQVIQTQPTVTVVQGNQPTVIVAQANKTKQKKRDTQQTVTIVSPPTVVVAQAVQPNTTVVRTGYTGPNGRLQAQSKIIRPMNVVQPTKTIQAPKAVIPWTVSAAEQEEQKRRWAKFAAYMSRPFPYTSAYVSIMQKLDAQGAINLNRITRTQWPNVPVNYVAFMSYSTYEGLEGELVGAKTGVELTINALTLADQFIQKGYRVAYIHNPTSQEYIGWYDFFLEKTQKDLFVYISGYAKRYIDYSYDPQGETQNLFVFYDEGRKANLRTPRKIYPITGFTVDTISEDVLYDTIARVNRTATLRIVFLQDLYATEQIFLLNSLDPLPSNPPPRLVLPNNTLLLESFVDLDGLIAQGGGTGLNVPNKTANTSPLGTAVSSVLKAKPGAAPNIFWTVYTTLVKNSKATVLSAIVASVPTGLYTTIPFVPQLAEQQKEPNLAWSTQTVVQMGSSVSALTQLPVVVLSQVEVESAQSRWNQFCAEMRKPVIYTSKFKVQLNQLDAIGAINLDRLSRDQIPNVVLGNCLALFFSPLEGLPNTLNEQPANDAVSVATVFVERGYTVLYFCDATPVEYYTWMDWILDNVRNNIVAYFSGHGTQAVNRVARQQNSLSEVLVFYDESTKKKNAKIKAVQGITTSTISDDLLYNLILSKQFPETRIVLIHESSHNDSVFTYDEQIDPTLPRGLVPGNVVSIAATADDRIANQVSVGGKTSSLFTYYLTQLLTSQPNATFQDLYTYMGQSLGEYQDISLIVSQANIVGQSIIANN